MKILMIAHDVPFPPTHGGRVDMWRRLNLFHQIGAEIFIVTWSYRPIDQESWDALTSVCNKIYVLPIRKTWRYRAPRFRFLITRPLYEAIRATDSKTLNNVIKSLDSFLPDLIWLDGLYGGSLALDISSHLNIPIYYRSHNVEYRYMRILSKSANDVRSKLVALAGCWKLKSFENKVMDASKHIFDCSTDDYEFWLNNGYRNITYLPPISPAISCSQSMIQPTFDIAYLGNLHVANNKAGVRWLVERIMPEIWSKRPSTTLLIAGSNASEEIVRLVAGEPRISLERDPKDAIETLLKGRVLINPVQHGSGVSIKTLDMLATGRPVVCTPQGAKGLYKKMSDAVRIGNNANELASLLVDVLDNYGTLSDACSEHIQIYNSGNVLRQLKQYIPELLSLTDQDSDA
jgi:glycosyltransferase involved in cell wall biosynthesis